MIHHPVVLCSKVVVLLVLAIVLIVLHGVLGPEEFRVAVYVSVGVFAVAVVGIWVRKFESLCDVILLTPGEPRV